MAKRANDFTLKEAIEAFLEAYQLDGRRLEEQVKAAWPEVMGKMVEKETKRLFIRNNTLFVTLDSPVLRQELSYAREKICKALNEVVGAEVIEEVVFR
jgi:hypothetical protein